MAVTILFVSLGVVLQWAAFEQFVYNPDLDWAHLALSAVLLVLYGRWCYHYNTGRNRSRFVAGWNAIALWRRIVCVIFLPFFVFLFIWTNISHTLPALYTLAFGETVSFRDVGEKSVGSGKSGCRYRIDLKENNGWLFCYSIERNQYAALPETEFPVVVRARRSPLGTLVISIRHERRRERDGEDFKQIGRLTPWLSGP